MRFAPFWRKFAELCCRPLAVITSVAHAHLWDIIAGFAQLLFDLLLMCGALFLQNCGAHVFGPKLIKIRLAAVRMSDEPLALAFLLDWFQGVVNLLLLFFLLFSALGFELGAQSLSDCFVFGGCFLALALPVGVVRCLSPSKQVA